jgi:hypothetical protein
VPKAAARSYAEINRRATLCLLCLHQSDRKGNHE